MVEELTKEIRDRVLEKGTLVKIPRSSAWVIAVFSADPLSRNEARLCPSCQR